MLQQVALYRHLAAHYLVGFQIVGCIGDVVAFGGFRAFYIEAHIDYEAIAHALLFGVATVESIELYVVKFYRCYHSITCKS